MKTMNAEISGAGTASAGLPDSEKSLSVPELSIPLLAAIRAETTLRELAALGFDTQLAGKVTPAGGVAYVLCYAALVRRVDILPDGSVEMRPWRRDKRLVCVHNLPDADDTSNALHKVQEEPGQGGKS